jgi:predicted MFS family arabinose efflux permease
MPAALLWLAVGTFAVGTEAFLIAGLLPAIAADLDVGLGPAGHLVTVFAVTYAVGAPILAAVTGHLGRRIILLSSLAGFTLTNIAAAFAPSYGALLGLRMTMACFSCLYTPAAMALAGTLVPPSQRGRALALVAAGTTVAVALGVPFGTLVGGTFGWRASFLVVAMLGVLAGLGIALGVKRMPPLPSLSLAERLAPLGAAAVRHALLMAACWVGGAFTLYIYLGPYFAPLGINGAALALVLAVFGTCAFVGNLTGGWATDRFGSLRVMTVVLFSLIAIFIAFALLPSLPGAAPIGVGLVGVWAAIGWSALPARQARLIALAPQSAPLLLALNASAIYLGMAIGAGLGSLALASAGPPALGWAAALVEVAALMLLVAERRATPALKLAPAG